MNPARRRRAAPPAPARRRPRPPPGGTRPLAARPRTKALARPASRPPRRKGLKRAALLLLLLLLLLAAARLLWPAPEEEPVPPPPPAPAAVQAKLPPKKKAAPAARAPASASQRELLLKAIQSRASDLRVCGKPPGSPARLLTRIKVAHAGTVRTVSFATADPIPKPLADCVKQRIGAWSFADVGISSDVDVLVSFALSGDGKDR